MQHICNGEILIKYPTSHSVSSMIRQGIGGASAGATEKWVVVDKNNSSFHGAMCELVSLRRCQQFCAGQ